MSLDKFKANGRLVEKISRAIGSGKAFHAYIIEGDPLSGKREFALEFCKALVCLDRPGIGCDTCVNCRKIDHGNCEDLHIVESDGISVKDEQISKLQSELKKKPLGSRNMAIIDDADTMTKRAQNRLLKTLEEPYEGTVIILLSDNRENLIDTIRSRCILYRLEPAAEDTQIGQGAEALFSAVMEKKNFFEKKDILSRYMKNREDAFTLLDGLERIYERLLTWEDSRRSRFHKDEIFRAVELIEEARRDLLAKVNYQYAVKNLILKIGG